MIQRLNQISNPQILHPCLALWHPDPCAVRKADKLHRVKVGLVDARIVIAINTVQRQALDPLRAKMANPSQGIANTSPSVVWMTSSSSVVVLPSTKVTVVL